MNHRLLEFWQKRAEWRPGLVVMLVTAFVFTYTFQAPVTLGRFHHNLPLILRILSGSIFLWGFQQVLISFFPKLKRYQLKRIGRNRVSLPRDGVVYLLIMMVLFVGSVLSRENMLMLVFAMMTGPFVLNGWITYSMLKKIKLKRIIPQRVMVGETFTAEIILENNKRLIAAYLMEVNDSFTNRNDKLEASVVFRRVGPRQKLSAHYYAKLSQRGIYQFGPLQVSTRYPLGLVKRGAVFSEFSEIIVHPQIGRLSTNWADDFFSIAELAQQNQSRRGVFDDEFNHIREYRSGDSQRSIHWRSSARQGELMVQEYHQNRNYDLIIGLDLWLPSYFNAEQAERVEWAISFVGTLCREHLRYSRDTKLTLVSQGKTLELLEVGIGSMGLEYLLDFLATLEPGKSQTEGEFAKLISQMSSPRSRTVLLTTRDESGIKKHNRLQTIFEEQGVEVHGQWRMIEAAPEILSRWLVLETD
ncbi:DUF58 domain-containing protein [Gimesia fumaroli]|uniref:DUF58 domain-containing protein n=1 Tax=Gimesia fumaroli TaxID=2527976 RepID=A0A518IDB6_9PLAN|nr:DUF58 domain-containing protein [Gimesia fumaroli]QDV51075.1 hypothetical protein Enr17x_31270 [Gimesia fumaroli]